MCAHVRSVPLSVLHEHIELLACKWHLWVGPGVIHQGVLGGWLSGVAFDLKGNVWVTDCSNNKVVKLSQDGRLLQTICHAGSESDRLSIPYGVSISPERMIYICDHGNHRVTVYDEEGKFLFALARKEVAQGVLRHFMT